MDQLVLDVQANNQAVVERDAALGCRTFIKISSDGRPYVVRNTAQQPVFKGELEYVSIAERMAEKLLGGAHKVDGVDTFKNNELTVFKISQFPLDNEGINASGLVHELHRPKAGQILECIVLSNVHRSTAAAALASRNMSVPQGWLCSIVCIFSSVQKQRERERDRDRDRERERHRERSRRHSDSDTEDRARSRSPERSQPSVQPTSSTNSDALKSFVQSLA